MTSRGDFIVEVHAWRDWLITAADGMAKSPDWTRSNKDRAGCVLTNTARHLAISKEALKLLKNVARNGSPIGDVDWFQDDERGWCFSWVGGIKAIKKMSNCTASRTHQVPSAENYTLIPNNPSKNAVDIIESTQDRR